MLRHALAQRNATLVSLSPRGVGLRERERALLPRWLRAALASRPAGSPEVTVVVE